MPSRTSPAKLTYLGSLIRAAAMDPTAIEVHRMVVSRATLASLNPVRARKSGVTA